MVQVLLGDGIKGKTISLPVKPVVMKVPPPLIKVAVNPTTDCNLKEELSDTTMEPRKASQV